MQASFWLNGQPTETISADCRGLHYGDGHFTTMALREHKLELWPLHRQRLINACWQLALQEPDWSVIEPFLANLAEQHERCVVKLTLFRSAGGRGYSSVGCHGTEWLVSLSPWPAHVTTWQREGVKLGLCCNMLAPNPTLAGFKHLNRLEQIMIRQEIDQQGWDEGVVCDQQGYVVEACSANILWLAADDRWYTPDLSLCGVAGVMRQHVADFFASQQNELIQIQAKWPQVQQARAVAISSALLGLVPVVQIATHAYDPKPVVQLAAQLSEFSR